MDIGKEDAPFVIEPLVEPVPGRTSEPIPDPVYDPAPEREREKVPA